MKHADHVRLLRAGVLPSGVRTPDKVPQAGDVWADVGAGHGAFTLALAELLGPSGTIYAIDQDQRALTGLNAHMRARYPGVALHCQTGDFTQRLMLPPLDGLVMANALHFVQDKVAVMTQLREYLRPDGRLILVEYNTDRGNRWVPYPLTFAGWQAVAEQAGYHQTRLLATHPSSFLGEFFAAVSLY